MKLSDHPLVNLAVNVMVLMAMFSAVKLAWNKAPDGGIVGDIKRFFLLA